MPWARYRRISCAKLTRIFTRKNKLPARRPCERGNDDGWSWDKFLNVIASESEAIQDHRNERLDCFVASAPRNDAATNMNPRSRGAMRPSCANELPHEIRGRRESRVPAAPA